MRLFKTRLVPIFSLVIIALIFVSKIDLDPVIDRQRRKLYEDPVNAKVTIGLIWIRPKSQVEKRYSFAAGADYALREFIAKGRLRKVTRDIQLVTIDETDQQNKSIERNLHHALDDPSLVSLLGFTFSVDAHKAAIISAKRDIFLMTPSATWPALTKHGFNNLFRIVPDDADSARLLASFVKSRGYTQVGIIYSMYLHGNAVAPLLVEELRKQGVTVAFNHAYPPNQQPTFPDVVNIIGPQLQHHSDLDALFMIDDLNISARMLVMLRKAGVDIPILGTDSLDFPAVWREAGKAAEGVCFISLRSFDENNKEISGLYRTVVGIGDRNEIGIEDFAHYGFLDGYYTMSVYLSAVEKSESFYPRELGIVLRNQPWDTLHGQVRFSPSGDIIGRKIVVNEIVDGHPKTVFAEESK